MVMTGRLAVVILVTPVLLVACGGSVRDVNGGTYLVGKTLSAPNATEPAKPIGQVDVVAMATGQVPMETLGKSDGAGNFKISIQPGDYRLTPQCGSAAQVVTVHIRAGQTTNVNLLCLSGPTGVPHLS